MARVSEPAPAGPVSISEVAAATGVPVRKVHRLIDDRVLPATAAVRVGGQRAIRAFALPMVEFGAGEGQKVSKPIRRDAMRLIEAYTTTHWDALLADPDREAPLYLESGALTLTLGGPIRTAMRGLNKLLEARRMVVVDPDIRGGLPTIAGTRIGVYEAADAVAADGLAVALEDFPSLTPERLELAALYAAAYPRRGRPKAIPASDRRILVSESIRGRASG